MTGTRLIAAAVLSLGAIASVQADEAQPTAAYTEQPAAVRAGALVGARVRSYDGRTGAASVADNGTNLFLPGVRPTSGNPSNPE